MITIEPYGGLCNRLRFIDSARVLCRTINRPLTVQWMISPDLSCEYEKLFVPQPDITVVQKTSYGQPHTALGRQIRFIGQYLQCRLRYRKVLFQSELRRQIAAGCDFTDLKRYPSVYLAGCDRFFRPQRRFLPLAAAEPIEQAVKRVAAAFASNTIGVHIRRTDHSTVTAYSPQDFFIRAMQRQIDADSQVQFFLATDSPQVESEFLSRFGERILCRPRQFTRQTPEGVCDALIDLLCLSRTRKIIGSRLSSFSETAAQINDIPLESMKVE